MTPAMQWELARVCIRDAEALDVLADETPYPKRRAALACEAERLRVIGVREATKAEGRAA